MQTADHSHDQECAYLIACIIRDIRESENTAYRRELYEKAASELEMTQQFLKPEIAGELHRRITSAMFPDDPNGEWHSGYFWDVMKENGWTRSSDAAALKGRTADAPSGCEKENAEMIDIARAHMDWWSHFLDKLKSQHFESEMAKDPTWSEEKYLLRKAAEMASEDIDGRQTVTTQTQYLLVQGLGKGSIQLAAKLYVARIKELAAPTTKQASKILAGMGRKCHIRFDPKNQDEAAACGYVGVQCTNLKCRSWRVTLHRTKTATLWCFGCDSEFPRTLEKLPLLRGVPMDRSGVF